jgi:hypothetical protein
VANARSSPFIVHRSSFTVHRSPFGRLFARSGARGSQFGASIVLVLVAVPLLQACVCRSQFTVRHSPFTGFGVRGSEFVGRCGLTSHGAHPYPYPKPKSIPTFVPSAPLW